MSKICVNANISILIIVSTCKQLSQSEPMEFSKNGLFQSKGEVIIFAKWSSWNPNPEGLLITTGEVLNIATLHHLAPLLQKINRNRVNQIPQKILPTKILDI